MSADRRLVSGHLFPYREEGNPPILRPSLDVRLSYGPHGDWTCRALVDTGAPVTFFDRGVADALNVKVRPAGAELGWVTILGGTWQVQYEDVDLSAPNAQGLAWTARVAFVLDKGLQMPFQGVLGSRGFLDQFAVMFNQYYDYFVVDAPTSRTSCTVPGADAPTVWVELGSRSHPVGRRRPLETAPMTRGCSFGTPSRGYRRAGPRDGRAERQPSPGLSTLTTVVAMSDEVDRFGRAQEAIARRDYAAAYDDLADLRRTGQLDSEGLYALGDAAWWLGLIRETIELCEECHERFLAEGRLDRAAATALETGFHWMMRGEPEVGSGWMSRARRLLEGQPPGVAHGWLTLMDSQQRLGAGDVAGALEGASELQRMGRALDEPGLASQGLALEGTVAIRSGDLNRGFELLDEAMLPVLAGRIGPGESGNLYCQMIAACMDLADVARARRWTEATERWCAERSDAVMFVGICRVHRAQLLRVEGRWDEAEQAAAEACRDLAELNVDVVAEGHYEIGESRRLRGDLERARVAYDQAASLGRQPEPGSSLLLLAEGRNDEANSSIRIALAEEGDPFRRARLLAAQVEVACRSGDYGTAEAAATELEQIASIYRSPGFRTWAQTARGAVLVGCGEHADAVRPLREALAACRDMRAAHDAGIARALLDRALEPPSDDTSTMAARPGELTGREWEILTAVAEGLSNRDIAARFVISEKTVARHLANVFAKIGVSSRTAAVAWAHHEGGLD